MERNGITYPVDTLRNQRAAIELIRKARLETAAEDPDHDWERLRTADIRRTEDVQLQAVLGSIIDLARF